MGLQSNHKKNPHSFDGKTDSELADILNIFYNRFNIYDFTKELSTFREPWAEQNVAINIDKNRVHKILRGVKERESPGPDNIGGRLIKSCAEPLSDIFAFIFNKSLQLHQVPHLWKESAIVPVPKTKVPKSLDDFRPVALTSLIMKAFEKIIKQEILAITQSQLDPLQFAYRAGRGVEDATGSLLNTVFNHLEGPKQFVRLLFIDFSSAFNCIQPHILADRLLKKHNINPGSIAWLVDFLTSRSQRVKVNGILSGNLLLVPPQGCVLSPLLFVLYTNECRSQYDGRQVLKFADDSVIVSLLNESVIDHGPIVKDFNDWCKRSFLNINVS